MPSNNPIDWTRMMQPAELEDLKKSPEFRDWLIGVLADENKSTRITFKKKDGTVREMRCTRNPAYTPAEFHPKNESVESPTTIRAFDLEKCEWRSFVVENVMEVNYEF